MTLSDVAQAAGVSIATASWAINDNKKVRIPEATRVKVRKVADRLGYRPNALAKGLAQGASSLIGFVADGVATTPFAGQMIAGAQEEAWAHGKLLLVVNTNGETALEESALALLREHQVQGVIYSTWYHRSVAFPKGLEGIPTVLVNCFDDDNSHAVVVPDEEQGGYAATSELLKAGHRRVMFLNTVSPSPARTDRLKGYRRALDEWGVAFDEALVVPVRPDQDGGYAAARTVVKSGVEAVFCHNDRVAMGLYDGLKERGVSIPDDVSVVGFDNQEVISAHLHPALTTVGLPHYELGVLGVRRLLAMDEIPSEEGADQLRTLVECPTVRRDSVRTL
ncbi:LacI family DNA-binding transcriptional regulator [Bifidobacterium lemurum]|uniref:LacI family DNA-binding transcriptional regulator n=1 Tax=Bifidobacterium lemurum TaxID=1603886 RepID=UPI001F32426F|nr:LacI family DNA-binding transcriptional regulator [Bifidobacterium lemurum]